MEWARAQGFRFAFGYGRGGRGPVLDYAGRQYYPVGVNSLGKVEIGFQYMTRQPPFDEAEMRHELRRRLNEIPGISISKDAITRRPSIPLTLFAADPKALESLIAVLDWCFETARAA